jgi:hypothetical protein
MEVKTEGGKWKLILIVIKGNDQFVSGAQFGGGHCAGAHQAPYQNGQIPKYLFQEPREIHIFL